MLKHVSNLIAVVQTQFFLIHQQFYLLHWHRVLLLVVLARAGRAFANVFCSLLLLCRPNRTLLFPLNHICVGTIVSWTYRFEISFVEVRIIHCSIQLLRTYSMILTQCSDSNCLLSIFILCCVHFWSIEMQRRMLVSVRSFRYFDINASWNFVNLMCRKNNRVRNDRRDWMMPFNALNCLFHRFFWPEWIFKVLCWWRYLELGRIENFSPLGFRNLRLLWLREHWLLILRWCWIIQWSSIDRWPFNSGVERCNAKFDKFLWQVVMWRAYIRVFVYEKLRCISFFG